jgi:hypothetical protein
MATNNASSQFQGTVGINSLQPHPWSEPELQQIAELLKHFLSKKQPSH